MLELLIYIPTYNRPIELKRTLDVLFSRFVDFPQVRIHVGDNHSTKLLDLEKYYPVQLSNGKLSYNRNLTNIGMSANIMKGFDFVEEASWLLILSDDDLLSDFNSKELLRILRLKVNSVAAVKFNGTHKSEATLNFQQVLEECRSVKGLNSYLFLSNTIYNVKYVLPHIGAGYLNLHTYTPHFLVLLKVLSEGANIFTYPRYLVNYVVTEIGYNYWKVAGIGVSGVKNFNWDMENDTLWKIINIFHIHNDFKVLLELRLDALRVSSSYYYKYHARIYLTLIKDGRGLVKRFILQLFAKIIFYKLTFNVFFYLLKKSGIHQEHVKEMIKKYD
jgi:hypothetical protein